MEFLLPFGQESFVLPYDSKNINIKLYGSLQLPVLYVCETWSLTLREEHRQARGGAIG